MSWHCKNGHIFDSPDEKWHLLNGDKDLFCPICKTREIEREPKAQEPKATKIQ